jgi:hypothetical protein
LSAADLAQDLQPRDMRHHDVQQDDVGGLFMEQLQRLARIVGRDKTLVAGGAKVLLHQADVDRFVVDDHDPRIGLSPAGGRAQRGRSSGKRIVLLYFGNGGSERFDHVHTVA